MSSKDCSLFLRWCLGALSSCDWKAYRCQGLTSSSSVRPRILGHSSFCRFDKLEKTRGKTCITDDSWGVWVCCKGGWYTPGQICSHHGDQEAETNIERMRPGTEYHPPSLPPVTYFLQLGLSFLKFFLPTVYQALNKWAFTLDYPNPDHNDKTALLFKV